MLIRIGYDIRFDLPADTPMQLLLNIYPQRDQDLESPETLAVHPAVPMTQYLDPFGNRCVRLVAKAGEVQFTNDTIIRDPGVLDPHDESAVQHPVEELPDDVLQFLLASRYCEVDLFKDIAWNLFANTPLNFKRAQAVNTWAHQHMTFSYPNARSTRTAMDAYNERSAVCRDFMHLAITMCRAMNIPARYCTGYLGDIGVPPDVNPMDFSAWYEVYMGGKWWTMDARHDERRIGRVLMARGRDATDCALTTAFGWTSLKKFFVITDEVK